MPHKDLAKETEAEIRHILARRIGVSPTDKEALIGWSPMKTLRSIPIDQRDGLMFALSATTLIIDRGVAGFVALAPRSVLNARADDELPSNRVPS